MSTIWALARFTIKWSVEEKIVVNGISIELLFQLNACVMQSSNTHNNVWMWCVLPNWYVCATHELMVMHSTKLCDRLPNRKRLKEYICCAMRMKRMPSKCKLLSHQRALSWTPPILFYKIVQQQTSVHCGGVRFSANSAAFTQFNSRYPVLGTRCAGTFIIMFRPSLRFDIPFDQLQNAKQARGSKGCKFLSFW